MTPETEKKFYRAAITEALSRYGVKKKDSKEIWRSECFVLRYTKNKKEYILKVTHSDMRSKGYILGELDFINDLIKRGVDAAKPVVSEAGNFVEIVDDKNNPGEFFIAYSFERMQGKLASESRLTSGLLFNWGKTMGEIHAITKRLKQKDAERRRYHWHERDLMSEYRDYIKGQSGKFYDGVTGILERVRSYPANRNSYGLIHADFHRRNFFVHKGNVKVFDFDDSEYHYFVYDIAIPLNGYVNSTDRKSLKRLDFFLSNFMEGYNTANKLNKFWFEVMNDFILTRRIYLVSMLYRAEALSRIGKEWQELVKRDIDLIENQLPATEIDFTKYASV